MRIFKLFSKYLFAIGFVLAGLNHFVNPAFYLRIMPPYLPTPLFLIYLSGFFEILFGVLLGIPKWTRLAAWGIVLLLIAVFPANIYMATHPELFPDISPNMLYIRLPFQLIFIAWAYWFTRHESTAVDSK
jgi:uncharacterized membrane protein